MVSSIGFNLIDYFLYLGSENQNHLKNTTVPSHECGEAYSSKKLGMFLAVVSDLVQTTTNKIDHS